MRALLSAGRNISEKAVAVLFRVAALCEGFEYPKSNHATKLCVARFRGSQRCKKVAVREIPEVARGRLGLHGVGCLVLQSARCGAGLPIR